MLRAQAFEGLLTLLPILLVAVVSVLLRARAARKRKRREESIRAAESSQPSTTARQPATTRPAAPARPGATPGAAPSRFAPHHPERAPVTNRESYVYPPPLPLNGLKKAGADSSRRQTTPMPRPLMPRRREMHAVDLRERMRSRADSMVSVGKPARANGASITERLEKLPPLKRAVVWAEILGPPGGRQ
jgi:hypothetical protein